VDKARARTPNPIGRDPAERPRCEESVASGGTTPSDGNRRAEKRLQPRVPNRALQCLVAFELKVEKFKPADLGQLSFYVEALDRDVKKAHERPSIGVLLCATKDDEVVEYALARTASPTLVAEYQTMLPPKEVMRRKLHELYAQLSVDEPDDERGKKRRR
jgi:hypothetical protein